MTDRQGGSQRRPRPGPADGDRPGPAPPTIQATGHATVRIPIRIAVTARRQDQPCY